MNNVVVLEAADDVRYGVAFADVGEELVSKAFTFARACYEAGNVNKFDGCRNNAVRLNDFSELREPRIRNLDDADVRFDRAEGIIFSCNSSLGQRIEDGGLAYVGQSDDAAFQTHSTCSKE